MHYFFYKTLLVCCMILMFQAIRGQNIPDEPLGGKVPENVLDSVEIDGLNYSLIKVNGYPDSRYCYLTGFAGNNERDSVSVAGEVLFSGECYPVRIKREAFINNDKIKILVLNDGISEIGREAFAGCNNLKEISFPESLDRIGTSAFENCTGISRLVLKCTTIEANVFSGCTSLQTVDIHVDGWGSGIFRNCRGLRRITFNQQKSYQGVADESFLNCTSLESVELGCSNVGNNAFMGCSSLHSVSIAEGISRIGNRAFMGCSSLETIFIPSTVESIGVAAFSYCENLHSITVSEQNASYTSGQGANAIIDKDNGELIAGCGSTVIPESVCRIGDYAFCGQNIRYVNLSDNVVHIGCYAFANCNELREITIPSSVQSMGSKEHPNVFYGCNLHSVSVAKDNSFFKSKGNCIIETGSNRLITGGGQARIPKGTVSIAGDSFRGCTGISQLLIPASVSEIVPGAFYGCTGINKVTVNRRNKVFDSRSGCNAIMNRSDNSLVVGFSSTVIPDETTAIGPMAFAGMDDIVKITIPGSVDSIFNHAFSGCENLRQLELPDSMHFIGEGAFAECTSLSSVKCPDNVTFISNEMFMRCSGLTEVTLSGRTELIGFYAFGECVNLKYLHAPSDVSICPDSFYGCDKLIFRHSPENRRQYFRQL